MERPEDFPSSLHGLSEWEADAKHWDLWGVVGRPLYWSADPTTRPRCLADGGAMGRGTASMMFIAIATSNSFPKDLLGMGESGRGGTTMSFLEGAIARLWW